MDFPVSYDMPHHGHDFTPLSFTYIYGWALLHVSKNGPVSVPSLVFTPEITAAPVASDRYEIH